MMMNDSSDDGKHSLTEIDAVPQLPSDFGNGRSVQEKSEAELIEEDVETTGEDGLNVENEEIEADIKTAERKAEAKLAEKKEAEEDNVYRDQQEYCDEDLDENIADEQQEQDWEKQRDLNQEENLAGGNDLVMNNQDTDSEQVHADHFSGSSSSYYNESLESRRNSRGKLFIGGLTRDTTTEMLTRHFQKYGEIIDSVIMKNRSTGHPRGFGFVTFSDPSVVDIVLKDSHILDGKTVEAKRTVPREGISAPSVGPRTKKIFVGGLKTSTTEDEIKIFFEKFGKIMDCQVMQDHSTGRSRGFGFITYESEESVENALAQGTMHELDGKQVEIKKAEPKRGDEIPLSQNHDRGNYRRVSGGPSSERNSGYYGALSGATPPYYGGGSGAPYRGVIGHKRGYSSYGASYSNDGGYGGCYGYGGVEGRSGGMAYNYGGYGPGHVSGSGYGNVYGSGGGYGINGGGYGGSGGGYGINGGYGGSGGGYGINGGYGGSGGGYGMNGGGYGASGGYGANGRGSSSGRYHPYSR